MEITQGDPTLCKQMAITNNMSVVSLFYWDSEASVRLDFVRMCSYLFHAMQDLYDYVDYCQFSLSSLISLCSLHDFFNGKKSGGTSGNPNLQSSLQIELFSAWRYSTV